MASTNFIVLNLEIVKVVKLSVHLTFSMIYLNSLNGLTKKRPFLYCKK